MGKRSGLGGRKTPLPDERMFAMDLACASSPDLLLSDRPLETAETIADTIIHRRNARRRMLSVAKQERLQDVITGLPAPGESWHVVSSSQFDFWSFVPVCVDRLGGHVDLLYGSTWTMNRQNVIELFELFDAGRADRIAILTGTYFKRRESAVYARLAEGMITRGQRFIAFENHTKILLLQTPTDHITIESSANFTANPRLEQYVLSNDRDLLEFHRSWMEEMLE